MSIRTIIVGILAALCGICATAGVMMMNNRTATEVQRPAAHTLYVAKIDIEMGQQIAENVLTTIQWHSDQIPSRSFEKKEDLIDQFAVDFIPAGEVISAPKIADSPTTLLPAFGMRAYAIESRGAADSVGQNLVPGNRVDILWQNTGRGLHARMPGAVRLLQNVKILAIGRVMADLNKAANHTSITFELKPRMDENLSFAANTGTLQLSLRNPEDHEGVEPREITNLKTVMEALQAEDFQLADYKQQNQELEKYKESMQTEVAGLKKQNEELKQQISGLTSEEEQITSRDFLDRIPSGMRAIAIATPSESSGLAGLLEPTDRVDLQLTASARDLSDYLNEPSESIIENLEVLAVGTRVFTIEGNDAKKSTRTVTLAVFPKMIAQIESAQALGTLTLILRGKHDSQGGMPAITMTVGQFRQKHMRVGTGPPILTIR